MIWGFRCGVAEASEILIGAGFFQLVLVNPGTLE